MYFFLINNNFHFDDAMWHIESKKIPVDLLHFICVPHTLDMNRIKESGYNYTVILSPLTKSLGCINIFSLFRCSTLNQSPNQYLTVICQIIYHLLCW